MDLEEQKEKYSEVFLKFAADLLEDESVKSIDALSYIAFVSSEIEIAENLDDLKAIKEKAGAKLPNLPDQNFNLPV